MLERTKENLRAPGLKKSPNLSFDQLRIRRSGRKISINAEANNFFKVYIF